MIELAWFWLRHRPTSRCPDPVRRPTAEDLALQCWGIMQKGGPGAWNQNDDKILIREMWSSPIVFRRASKLHSLCDDAKAWNKEARRRIAYYRANHYTVDGERIMI